MLSIQDKGVSYSWVNSGAFTSQHAKRDYTVFYKQTRVYEEGWHLL
jgi:hypothetical protein